GGGRDLPRPALDPRLRRDERGRVDPPGRRELLGLCVAAGVRHGLGGRAGTGHRHAAVDRDRAVHLPLRAPTARVDAGVHRRPAGRRALRRVRAVGHPRPRARRTADLLLARRERGMVPAVRRPGLGHGTHDPHRRDRARGHDPAHHDRDLPRGLPADAGAPRGGGARAGRHPVGDDPHRRPPVRPLRDHLRRGARARPRARRDDGRRDGPLGHTGPGLVRPAAVRQPADDRRQHRAVVPGGVRRQHQRADRDRPDPVRRDVRGQRVRALDRVAANGILWGAPTTTQIAPRVPRPTSVPLTAGHRPEGAPWIVLGGSLVVSAALFGILALASGGFDWGGWLVVGALLSVFAIWLLSRIVEGARCATDRLVTALVTGAFVIAMIPLISVGVTVVVGGLARLDVQFFTESMRNVTG